MHRGSRWAGVTRGPGGCPGGQSASRRASPGRSDQRGSAPRTAVPGGGWVSQSRGAGGCPASPFGVQPAHLVSTQPALRGHPPVGTVGEGHGARGAGRITVGLSRPRLVPQSPATRSAKPAPQRGAGGRMPGCPTDGCHGRMSARTEVHPIQAGWPGFCVAVCTGWTSGRLHRLDFTAPGPRSVWMSARPQQDARPRVARPPAGTPGPGTRQFSRWVCSPHGVQSQDGGPPRCPSRCIPDGQHRF
jgi:hypothetical protein